MNNSPKNPVSVLNRDCSVVFDNGISGGSSRLLTLVELADWLGVKQRTIYKWVHQRIIPYHKAGKLLRFDRAIIQAWLSKKE